MQLLYVDMGACAAGLQLHAAVNTRHVVLAERGAAAAVDTARACDCDAVLIAGKADDSAVLQLVKQLKAEHRLTPVIVIVEQADAGAVTGLIDHGADDVLVRSRGMAIVLAHVMALVRRAHGHVSPQIRIGALDVHLGTGQCRVAGREIHLTPMEFRLIEALALRRDRLVPRTRLLELLYGDSNEPFAKSIDRFVHDIRNKFRGVTQDNYLQTGNRGFMLSNGQTCRPPGMTS